MTKDEHDKSAQENWDLARRWYQEGNKKRGDAAVDRAIEDEKNRDSWLYRTFGW